MKRKLLILYIILLISVMRSYGQEWQEPINTGKEGHSVCFDSDNNQYVSGEFIYRENQNMFKDINLMDLTNEDFGYFFSKLGSSQNIQWLKVIESDWGGYNIKTKLDGNNDIIMAFSYFDGITIDSERRYEEDHVWRNFIAKFSTNGELKWIKYFGTSLIEDLYIDSKNQIYVSGKYQGILSFNEESSISNESETGYYAKFDSEGQFLNAFSIGGSWNTSANILSILADSSENVYIGGFVAGNAYFGSTQIYASGTDQFIAKFDKNNNNIWVKHFGSKLNTRLESINSMSFDHTGEYIYAVGSIQGGTVEYDNHTLNVDDKNIFLGKFTLDGDVSWLKNFGNWSGSASDTEEAKCVAVVKNTGAVYLNGTFRGTASFDTHSISSLGGSGGTSNNDLFVAKVNPTGNVEWVNRCGGTGEDKVYSLAIDNNGDPCIGGWVRYDSDFGDYKFTGENQISGFFATIKDVSGQKDYDDDGVINDNDLYSNTPIGADVDANGGVVINPNDITISWKSPTCPNVNNAEISIQINNNYPFDVTVLGPNEFTNTYSNKVLANPLVIKELSSGEYQIFFSFSQDLGTEFGGYSLNISDSPEVTAKSIRADKSSKTATFNVSGDKNYSIYVNDVYLRDVSFKDELTHEILVDQLFLDTNHVKIVPENICRGVVEQWLTLKGDIQFYPNPTEDLVTLNGITSEEVTIQVYTLDSSLLFSEDYLVKKGSVVLSLKSCRSGFYIVRIIGNKNDTVEFKVIKK